MVNLDGIDTHEERVEALLKRIAESLDRAEAQRAEPNPAEIVSESNARRYAQLLDRMEVQMAKAEAENRPLSYGEKGGGE